MIIDPNIAVNNKLIKLGEYSKIQQSGIDITIKKIRKIISSFPDGRIVYEEVKLPCWLDMNCNYDFECHEFVELPQNTVATIHTRSTFNRRGAFVTAGLYDNGFKNYIGAVLHVTTALYLEANERIAQIVFEKTEHTAQYDGKYQQR